MALGWLAEGKMVEIGILDIHRVPVRHKPKTKTSIGMVLVLGYALVAMIVRWLPK